MNYPSLRFVFDRAKTATDEKQVPLYIELVHNQKKRYIPTGVKLRKGEYDPKRNIVIKRHDAMILTQTANTVMSRIQRYLFDLQQEDKEFSFSSFDTFIKKSGNNDSFLDFYEKQIKERNDLEESTRKQHIVALKKMQDYGKIITFSDLSAESIEAFDLWLHKVNMPDASQETIFGVHKRIKPYLKEAKRLRLIKENPYDYIRIQRGKTKKLRYLTQEELNLIEQCEIPRETIKRVRDVFLFACYTGLAYSDLDKFNPSNIQQVGEYKVYSDNRKKTGEEFVFVLFPEAEAILERYNYKLPLISNQQYNLRLKIVADYAGLDRELTSHMARHTFGTLTLAKGVPLHIIQKAMGHSKIATTEKYAKVINQSVIESMGALIGR